MINERTRITPITEAELEHEAEHEIQEWVNARTFSVGDIIRSFDFDFQYALNGERSYYVEGIIRAIAPIEGCAPNCDHYHIEATRRIFSGEDCPEEEGRMFYPAVNGNTDNENRFQIIG